MCYKMNFINCIGVVYVVYVNLSQFQMLVDQVKSLDG